MQESWGVAALRASLGELAPKSGEFPSRVFHYTGTSGCVGILSDAALWASSAFHLNDKLEQVEVYDILDRAVDEALRDPRSSLHREFLEELKKQAREHAAWAPIPYVVSFSEVDDSTEQWRAYAFRAGFSLGFDLADLRALKSEHAACHLLPCVYDEALKERQVRRFLCPSDEEIGRVSVGDIVMDCTASLSHLGAFFKSSKFASEKEWRLIVRGPKTLALRPTDEGPVPYTVINLDQNRGCLRSIMVGPSPRADQNKSALRQLVDRSPWKFELESSTVPLRNW